MFLSSEIIIYSDISLRKIKEIPLCFMRINTRRLGIIIPLFLIASSPYMFSSAQGSIVNYQAPSSWNWDLEGFQDTPGGGTSNSDVQDNTFRFIEGWNYEKGSEQVSTGGPHNNVVSKWIITRSPDNFGPSNNTDFTLDHSFQSVVNNEPGGTCAIPNGKIATLAGTPRTLSIEVQQPDLNNREELQFSFDWAFDGIVGQTFNPCKIRMIITIEAVDPNGILVGKSKIQKNFLLSNLGNNQIEYSDFKLTEFVDLGSRSANFDVLTLRVSTALQAIKNFSYKGNYVGTYHIRLDNFATNWGDTPPSITAPSDFITEATAMRTALTEADYGTAIAAHISGIASIVSDAPPTFPLGSTTVNWTATDNSGTTSTVTQTITLVDTTPPMFNIPSTLIMEATEPSGASVTFLASAFDILDGPITPTCAPSSGSTFSIGDTIVECTATDAAGNTGSASFKVTVEDTTPPTITAPADIMVECNTANGAAGVDLGTPTVSDDTDPNPTVTSDAPATFPLGSTTVTYTATDSSGNSASDTQTVTVEDTSPPSITAPPDIMVEANTQGGATGVNIGIATASDICDPSLTITNDAPSIFPLGDTSVRWTATDTAGNSATATQLVTVVDIHSTRCNSLTYTSKQWR